MEEKFARGKDAAYRSQGVGQQHHEGTGRTMERRCREMYEVGVVVAEG